MRTEKKVTIDQVAQLSGVSKTTVSRFLNGKYENISESTRCRIADVIRELDYKPDRTAQRMKAGKSMLIGCVIGDIGSPFSGILFRGISSVCNDAGYQVLFADSGEDPAKERKAVEDLMENRVDGLIINSAGSNDEFLTEVDRMIPVVLADRGLRQSGVLDSVVSPNREKAYECVSYLLACGYTKVAFITEGNRKIMPRMERYEGYCQAVKDLIPDAPEAILYEYRRTDDSCREAIRDFRNRFPGERIALLAVNGVVAQHVFLALKGDNIEPGYEFGLCAFDNWDWMMLAPPGITAVSLSSEDIGRIAATLLIDRIQNPQTEKKIQNIVLPARIVPRGSTVYSDEER